MGYAAPAGAVVITHIIGPGPHAVHAQSAFIPDHAFHRDQVARVYASTNRQSTYLGDWHTHPNGSTTLSATDRDTLRSIANAPAARVPEPLMLIVGGTIEQWQSDARAHDVRFLGLWQSQAHGSFGRRAVRWVQGKREVLRVAVVMHHG